MTGIERLRRRTSDLRDSGYRRLADDLGAIADQIEREQDAMVADSPYDALRPEDAEAIAWVREHGGLEQVRVDFAEGTAFGDVVDDIAERLGVSVAGLDSQDARDRVIPLLDRRLMPEGMEWPMVDGQPVVIGERLVGYGSDGDGYEVVGVRPSCGWILIKSYVHVHHGGEPVILEWDASKCHRPATKVLDADGVQIELGDDLYSVEGGLKLHVGCIDARNGKIATSEMYALDKWADPAMYTHRAPVLAADGKPLREGETVWDVLGKRQFTVLEIGPDTVLGGYNVNTLGVDGMGLKGWSKPSDLTHERPDSLDRLAEDIGAMVVAWRSNQDLFDAQEAAAGCVGENTMGAALESLVRRAKALAGDA